jgi:hypothetical protein
MEKYNLSFLTALVIASLVGCGDAQQNSPKNSDMDAISNQTPTKKSGMITQKITPCLWVDKDAKAVVDYYLSIFKNGKLKEYRKYENPPEEKGQGWSRQL